MNLEHRKILVLGGYGLVGMAVCRELLVRRPREIQIHSLRLEDEDLGGFVLYDVLTRSQPDVVIDCVNTATGIAYGDIFRSAEELLGQLEGGEVDPGAAERLLDALYMPRLIRHI